MTFEPEELELGENVTDQVRQHKPSGIVVSVRLAPEDSVKLIDLAEETGKTVSQIAREAIRSFISQSGHRAVSVPEITGDTPTVKIVAFTPLGPRTSKEGVEIKEEGTPMTRTGYLLGV